MSNVLPGLCAPRDVTTIVHRVGALGCSLFAHLKSSSIVGSAFFSCHKVRGINEGPQRGQERTALREHLLVA